MNKIQPRLNELYQFLEKENLIYNQSDFARKIGYDSSTVAIYMNGKRKISKNFIDRILAAFPMISPKWLFNGRGEILQPGDEKEKTSLSEPVVNYEKREIDADALESITNLSRSIILQGQSIVKQSESLLMQNEHIKTLLRMLEGNPPYDDGKKKSAV